MVDIKKKEVEEVVGVEDFIETQSSDVVLENTPFSLRFAALGEQIRSKTKETLKFDSYVDNISYSYVDTQQYKDLIGSCCDKCGVGFMFNVTDPKVDIQFDNKGIMIFVVTVNATGVFFDPWDNDGRRYCTTAFGLGVSRANNYAASIAQTNAMRNLLTNTFLIPTSDRDGDDVRQSVTPGSYLTDDAKAEKREQLLDKTKSSAQFATVQYGKIVYAKIQETLKRDDIEADFRKTLETFLDKKFVDGEPIAQEEDDTLWIVKKTAANKILSDLDAA